jgi:Carboxypeptidase regulatory-like domain
MMLRAFLCGPVFGACVLTSSALSQEATTELRIRLNGIDGAPVSGALVALLNARDSVVAEGLSTEAGARVLRTSPGVYRVRVRRIGYLPFVSSAVSLPRESALSLNIESQRIVLERIVVNSKSQCARNDPNTDALSTVWDEIDKALRSSQLTTEDLSGIGRAHTYRKEVGKDGTVISADTTVFSIIDRRPFGAIDPVTLANNGYVLGDAGAGWHYFAPDETVLLSEPFAATHCFRVVRQRDRTGQIGVSFEPIPRRQVADIVGVLWVDQETSELREVVFRFVNAGAMSQFDAGGFTHFRRVPSGAWIVDEWKLSVPRLSVAQRGVQDGYSSTVRQQYIAIGRIENGGGLFAPGELTGEQHRQIRTGVDSLNRKH